MDKKVIGILGIILLSMIVMPIGGSMVVRTENSSNASEMAVYRYLPPTVIRGENLTVLLFVDMNASKYTLEVYEDIPAGWKIISSNPSNFLNYATGDPNWMVNNFFFNLFNISDSTITYILQVPANATGNVTFSGYAIWYNGSDYPGFNISGDTSVLIIPPKTAVTSNRTLTDKATAGSRVNVTITLDVNESNKPDAVIVKDYFPAGWNVTSSAPLANGINLTNREIKWIFTGEQVFDRVISYIVEIPSNELGNRTFSGEVIYNDPSDNPITVITEGNSVISVEKQCLVKGDLTAMTKSLTLRCWTMSADGSKPR